MSRLNEKDAELVLGGDRINLSDTKFAYLGGEFLTNPNDYIEVLIYDTNDNFLESATVNSEDYYQDNTNAIRLKTGTILRRLGYDRGKFNVKYNFLRTVAGTNENLVVDSAGIVDTTFDPNDQVSVSSLGLTKFLRENKYYIHEISPSRNEIRLAPQKIQDEKYIRDFYDAQKIKKRVKAADPIDGIGAGSIEFVSTTGGDLNDSVEMKFVDSDASDPPIFSPMMVGGNVTIPNAFVTKFTPVRVSRAPGGIPAIFETEGDMRARFFLDRDNSVGEVVQGAGRNTFGDAFFMAPYTKFTNAGNGYEDEVNVETYGNNSGMGYAYEGEGDVPSAFQKMENFYRLRESTNYEPIIFGYVEDSDGNTARNSIVILRSNSTLPNLEIPTTYTWEVTGYKKLSDRDFDGVYPFSANNPSGDFNFETDASDTTVAIPRGIQNLYQAVTSDSTEGSSCILALKSNSIALGIKLTVQQATGVGVNSESHLFLPGIISNRDFEAGEI